MDDTHYHLFFQRYLESQIDYVEDSSLLWEMAINFIYHDAHYLIENSPDKRLVTTTIGICSHWLRPNQTRWIADGGFAWPSGYNGPPYSRFGLPEYDWFYTWVWNSNEENWSISSSSELQPLDKRKKYSRLNFEVILPARTERHQQAVVYTRWSPGSPTFPKEELKQYYGFRRKSWNQWELKATYDYPHVNKHYEKAFEYEHKNVKLDNSEVKYWKEKSEEALFL